MDSDIEETNWPENDEPSPSLSFIGAHWMQGSLPASVDRPQYEGIEGDSVVQTHGEVTNEGMESFHQNTEYVVSEPGVAHCAPQAECKPFIPVLNSPRCQEQDFQYPQSHPYYVRQQSEIGICTPAHYQSDNGFSAASILSSSIAVQGEPWSAYSAFNGSQDARYARRMQAVSGRHAFDVTHSISDNGNPGSAYWMRDDLETPMSSVNHSHIPILNAPSEHCRHPSQPSTSTRPNDIPNYPNFTHSNGFPHLAHRSGPSFISQMERRDNADRGSTSEKTEGNRKGRLNPGQGRHLAPSIQRQVSSASSQTTEMTSSTAISSQTGDVLTCPVDTCKSTFSGKYRKGNLKRHQRAYHSNKEPILCENGSCDETFNRSDARLKHYRRRHPELLVGNPLAPYSERPDIENEHWEDGVSRSFTEASPFDIQPCELSETIIYGTSNARTNCRED